MCFLSCIVIKMVKLSFIFLLLDLVFACGDGLPTEPVLGRWGPPTANTTFGDEPTAYYGICGAGVTAKPVWVLTLPADSREGNMSCDPETDHELTKQIPIEVDSASPNVDHELMHRRLRTYNVPNSIGQEAPRLLSDHFGDTTAISNGATLDHT